ncbi:sensor domain-containing diguanylate cyclase [Pseudomonas sp. SWI44]|uniref:sensor domain-containing diguanylate cyclase n=1 Tax=Pseudomonas sp. SWI44 TaxID=2083053 RepID=UPI000CE5E0EA|nr:sensor domain-containing diguanylate cyclase [Pseudomonas sp. SWI44]AVD88563.1 hypothetical protein C4Q26_16050 [Pseudomonas sp. SWI44]
MSIKYAFIKVCIIGFLATIASGVLIYQESQRYRHTIDSVVTDIELYRLNRHIETLVLARQRNAKTISFLINIEQYLGTPSATSRQKLNNLLNELRDNLDASIIYILDEHGTAIASSNHNARNSLIGHNFSAHYYFKQAMLGLPAQQINLDVVTNRFGAYFSHPIIAESSAGGLPAHMLGTIVIKESLNLPLIGISKKEIATLQNDKTTALTLLIGPEGTVAASNADDWVGKILPADILADNMQIWEHEGARYKVSRITLTDFPGWQLIRLQPSVSWVGHVMAPLLTLAGGLYLAMLCAVFLAMFRLYRRVTVWIRKREISHIRLRRSHQRYRRLSYRDALTGLHNRRAYENDLTREMQRSERYEQPLTIALLDIDFFKKINDRHGHDVGDRVLRDFARLIQKNIRDTDSAYRFGGEEFIIILPETDLKAANAVITRIQSSLLEDDNETLYTFSCGISLQQPKDTAEQLFERADELLYQVKENGRNGIRLQS